LNGNTLSITKGNSIVLSSAVDLDADPTNEIQNLTIKKDTLCISKANYIILPKDNDADSTNEIQTLTYNNDTIKLSKSNNIVLPKDNDRDSLNELQTLQQNGNVVTMNKGGGSISVPTVTNTQNGSLNYATATGSNNFILTLAPPITQYIAGMTVNFKVPNSNTGHVTININNLGSKPLLKNVNDTLVSDDLLQNKMVSIVYDGINFQLLNQLYKSNEFAHFTEETLPGFGTSGSYSIVPDMWLNRHITNTRSIIGNSISRLGDTIILQSGTYRVHGGASAIFAGGTGNLFKSRIKNISDNITSIIGTSQFLVSFSKSYWSDFEGYITITSQKKFVIQCVSNNNAISWTSDSYSNSGENELHSYIIVEKIK